MTEISGEILKKLAEISKTLSRIADSMKKLGETAEGDSKVFQTLGAAAFNPKKDGCWNCEHRTFAPLDEFVHTECGLDGAVVGNSFICENWEKAEDG